MRASDLRNDRAALALDAHLHPLLGERDDYDPLLNRIGDARFVLIGEASHGSAEFYRERCRITQRLILQHGFCGVAVEADWPDAYRVNRYVRGLGDDQDARAALGSFRRFPQWMWRNTEVEEFVRWLRGVNASRPKRDHVGFYGLDLYSLSASIDAVLAYLERTDPDAARRARARYACFDHVREGQAYGLQARLGLDASCEDAVVAQLNELLQQQLTTQDGESFFDAALNARLVRNAERYYRRMFAGRVESWNLRDTHMMEVLTALVQHLDQPQSPAKLVVWAHNSHLGDARATEMGELGELNLGQLVREAHDGEAYSIGFSTYGGTVLAAHDWDEPPQRMTVRPALEGSYEALLHEVRAPAYLLNLRDEPDLMELLQGPRLQRAIGVIYRPATERMSHYFEARLPQQFDALIHIDRTSALDPLPEARGTPLAEEPETYPFTL